ncbi:MAG: hypothetical protein R3E58_14090 [Phycisphaerae bacterium]
MATKICAALCPSVCSTIFGSWGLGDRRYAHKQAAAADLIPYEPSYKFVTGGELLYTVAKIDDHLATSMQKTPAKKSTRQAMLRAAINAIVRSFVLELGCRSSLPTRRRL